MMRIRKAMKSDFEEYYRLYESLDRHMNKVRMLIDLKSTPQKKNVRKHFLKLIKDANAMFLVLDDGEHLQGFFDAQIDAWNEKDKDVIWNRNRWGAIGDVYISKKLRGKGYFSQMLKEFFSFLKKRKIDTCMLHTEVGNEQAVGVYTKLGFKPSSFKMICRIR